MGVFRFSVIAHDDNCGVLIKSQIFELLQIFEDNVKSALGLFKGRPLFRGNGIYVFIVNRVVTTVEMIEGKIVFVVLNSQLFFF